MDPLTAVRSFADAHGLPAAELVVLKDGSNLLVHLRPAPVVVRLATFTGFVRRDPLPYLCREVALVSHLASAGAAVVPPSDLVPPGPHRIGEWWGTVWRYVEHDRSVVADPSDVLRSLDALTPTLATFDGELPVYGPVATDLDLALQCCADHGLMAEEHTVEIRRRRDALLRTLDALPRQAQHGDAFPRNMLVTPAGLVWNDFEDCCIGSPLWDLAVLARRDESGSVRKVAVGRFGKAAVAAMVELRDLQAHAWTVLHDARTTDRLG